MLASFKSFWLKFTPTNLLLPSQPGFQSSTSASTSKVKSPGVTEEVEKEDDSGPGPSESRAADEKLAETRGVSKYTLVLEDIDELF